VFQLNDSILDSVKKVLGLQPDYDVFDPDIIMHINSVFGTLHQLGVGPEEGFMIEDASATWSTFLGGSIPLNPVKTYVCLRVRTIFDPPTTAYLVTSMKEQIAELEWRLNVAAEPKRVVLVPTAPLEDLDD
jgi:hypothetical protein